MKLCNFAEMGLWYFNVHEMANKLRTRLDGKTEFRINQRKLERMVLRSILEHDWQFHMFLCSSVI